MDDRYLYLGNDTYGVLVRFLRHERPDWEGRWLRQIQSWDDERLERDHHWIQWLFPLTTESQAVFAPRLRQFEVEAFKTDAVVHRELRISFARFLSFLGFEILGHDPPVVAPAATFHARSSIWMTPDNHNYLRISRVLGSLTLAGMKDEAEPFLRALEAIAEALGETSNIDGAALWYWRRSAGRPTVTLTP